MSNVEENEAYNEWIECNQDYVLETWTNTDPEAPEEIYEGVLDDDYPDIYDKWIEGLTIDDVPDEYIQDMYESYCTSYPDDYDYDYEDAK